MSDSMRERIARALEPKCRAFGHGDMPMMVAREFADAFLDALLEPTEAMHHAARDWSYTKYGKPIGFDASQGCFRAMIQAAKDGK